MPLYEIHHSVALLPHQLSAIAKAITNLHCSTFSAPSSFVNVLFHPATTSETIIGPTVFVGGEKHDTNYIIGHLRPGPIKPSSTLPNLVLAITEVWNEVVGSSGASKQLCGRLDDPLSLHNIFIMEDISGGAEQGFILPVAGKDKEWAEENMKEFETRARDGDESMGRLVEEIGRGLGTSRL